MTPDEALTIIQDEELGHYVWFKFPPNAADSVVIHRDGHDWMVFMTDERGAPEGELRFDDEDAALDDFIERLRLWNQVLVADRRRNRQRAEGKGRDGGRGAP